MRESGGDIGSSGRSSLNLDCVRTGVPDLARGILLNADSGICLAKDSLDVLANSEVVVLPRSVELLFLVPLRLKIDFQLLESRVLVSESRL